MATRATESLPEEIVVWEILIRLPPKHLFHCRTVCRAWLRVTSTHDFLLAHHGRQPSHPIVCGFIHRASGNFKSILAFDNRAVSGYQLQPMARLDGSYYIQTSCDGLLVLSVYGLNDTHFTVCNPATRQHAPLPLPPKINIWGMYLHRPTGDYRLLLYNHLLSEDRVGFYVFKLGSDHPIPRYIGRPETTLRLLRLETPALLHDSLHWLLLQHQGESTRVLVFDTIAESFRQMRAPLVGTESYISEMDGTLGIYACNKTTNVVNIWVLHNYEDELWENSYNVKLPVEDMSGHLGISDYIWNIHVMSTDGDIFLLVSNGGWMFYVDTDGVLVDSFHRDGQHLYHVGLRLKQSLVQQTFFPALEGYAMNSFPFV